MLRKILYEEEIFQQKLINNKVQNTYQIVRQLFGKLFATAVIEITQMCVIFIIAVANHLPNEKACMYFWSQLINWFFG